MAKVTQALYNDMLDELLRVKRLNAELLAALKQVQFGFNHRRCVACAGWDMSPQGETDMVHTTDCPVRLAIAHAEKPHDQ